MFRVDVASGNITQVTRGDRSLHGFDVNEKAGVMAYLANDFERIDDIRVAALDGGGERKITDVNSRLREELDLAHIERLPYQSSDGWQIDGFLVKPINFDPSKKYPMILSIHGGPVWNGLVSRSPSLRFERLGGVLLQSAGFHRIRTEVRAGREK